MSNAVKDINIGHLILLGKWEGVKGGKKWKRKEIEGFIKFEKKILPDFSDKRCDIWNQRAIGLIYIAFEFMLIICELIWEKCD